MTKPPIKRVTVKTKTPILPDPHRVFYMPAVLDTLKRGKAADIRALITGAKAAQAKYGDFDGMIKQLEDAAARAK
jgi:hypothetical protein